MLRFFSSLYFILFTVKLIENKALLLMCVGIKYFNQCWTKDFPQKPNINIYMLTQRNLSLWDVDKGQLMKELCPFILWIETMNDECHFNISKCYFENWKFCSYIFKQSLGYMYNISTFLYQRHKKTLWWERGVFM